MSSRSRWILFLVCCLLLAGGVGVFVFFMGREERLEVKPAHYSERLKGNSLTINGINHGIGLERNPLRPRAQDQSRVATTYYHRHGPLGLALERFLWFPGPENTFWSDARLPASLVGLVAGQAQTGAFPGAALPASYLVDLWSEPPVGVLDLGVGTPASYAHPMQIMDFYESNPAARELSLPSAGQPAKFHYVKDALERGAGIRIFDGPERKTLGDKGPDGFYRLLVVETARGHPDNPAVDRLTKEAMQLFFRKVTLDGIVCYHVSSRNYDLTRVVADVANELGYACRVGHDTPMSLPKGGPLDSVYFSSEWVMVARAPQFLEGLRAPPNPPPGQPPFWSTPVPQRRHVWTDELQNLASVRR
jgi:hypothetical protein